MEQRMGICVTADGVTIAYAAAGTGPPLVKVATPLDHLEQAWASPIWRHWLDCLSADHMLVRYDGRGTGLSDRQVEDFSLDARVNDLEAVVAALGLERFSLFALSHGGPVAIAYAARHPQNVTSLILCGSYARGWQHRQMTDAQREEERMRLALMRIGWGEDNPAFLQLYAGRVQPQGTQAHRQALAGLMQISATPEGAAAFEVATHTVDVREQARQVQAPTLVFHAQKDNMVPFEEGRLLAALIPRARFIPLASRNHILLAEEPAWARFAEETARFLGERAVPSGDRQTVTPASPPPTPTASLEELTLREREVLDLLAQGYRNTEIARELYLSPKTVRNYVSNIFSKLAVASRGEAIVRAREAGFGKSDA